jgi:hypothetical protein
MASSEQQEHAVALLQPKVSLFLNTSAILMSIFTVHFSFLHG